MHPLLHDRKAEEDEVTDETIVEIRDAHAAVVRDKSAHEASSTRRSSVSDA
jgi:hypothetical protein